MRKFFGGLCCLWLVFLVLTGAQAAGQQAGGGTTVVRKGEDCQAIVRRVYGDAPGAMARFHGANPQLGGLPHHLNEGDVVNVPPLRHSAQRNTNTGHRSGQGGQKRAPAPEQPRLTYVGPAVRTQTRREGWTEALPGQPIDRRMRIKTSASVGAEVNLQERTRLQMAPNATLVIDSLPQSRSAGEVDLLDGAVRAGVEGRSGGKALLVHTPSADVKVRGGARIEAEGRERALVAVYDGSTAVRARGAEIKVPAGQGTLVRSGARPSPPRALLPPPAWEGDGGPTLIMALGALSDAPQGLLGAVLLRFQPVGGAEQYLAEIARDARFNDRRAGGELVASPLRASLVPGTYLARISAIDADRLVGPPSSVRPVRVIALRSDGLFVAWDRDERGGLRPVLRSKLHGTLIVDGSAGGGPPLLASVDGGPPLECGAGQTLQLGPGEHRVVFTAEDARAEALFQVAPPFWPPPPIPVAQGTEPPDLPVPAPTPGFPARALHPRTRAYALLGVGAVSDRPADTYRLDVGGEWAFLGRRMSVDANLPLMYRDQGLNSGAALGDLSLGFRALGYRSAGNLVALGPLLRLQLPTGMPRDRVDLPTDPTAPDRHPVVLDPAAAVALALGPVGLLSTQGPTAVLVANSSSLRWSMSYVAEARLSWISLLAELDGSLGITGDSRSGAALGGGVRIRLSHWHLLFGARGGLGQGGQDLFGRYYLNLGTEWVR